MKSKHVTLHQLFTLTACGSLGGATILVSGSVVSVAKQDAWLAGLLMPILGLPIILVYQYLGTKYPDKTIVGICREILGKWLGTIVSIFYLFFYFTTTFKIMWYFSDFIITEEMPETPKQVINLLLMFAIVAAVIYGVETFARASEILYYISSFLILMILIFIIPKVQLDNLLPMFEHGFTPCLKATTILASYILYPIISIMTIFPSHVKDIQKTKKPLVFGYLWACFIVFFIILMSILVLGVEITSVSHYPTYILAKEVDIGVIFTRLEFVISASWIITEYIVVLIFFYSTTISLSELLGLKNTSHIVIPLGLIILSLSWVAFDDYIYQKVWDSTVWGLYSATFGALLPVLLFVILIIKSRLNSNQDNMT